MSSGNYIATPTPGASTLPFDAIRGVRRDEFLRKCRSCNKHWFYGNYWRRECDRCDPEAFENKEKARKARDKITNDRYKARKKAEREKVK